MGRGQDIFKACALGAQAIGLGSPVLYALASYGEDGIVRMVNMFLDELRMVMRLSGTPSINDITPGHVITTNLQHHIVPTPFNSLQQRTYEPLMPAARL